MFGAKKGLECLYHLPLLSCLCSILWIEGGRGKRGEEEKREVDGGKPEARDATAGGKRKGDGDSATEAVPVLLPSALSRAHKKSYAKRVQSSIC